MKIYHPGYGTIKKKSGDNDFFFSDNILKWIGSSYKTRRDKDNKLRKGK